MTTLTEKYKREALDVGFYYVKNEFGAVFIADYFPMLSSIEGRLVKDFHYIESDIEEVLAKVPSYEETENLTFLLKNRESEIEDLKQRNESLNSRDKNLCRIANEIREENFRLKSGARGFNALEVEKENKTQKDLLKRAREVLLIDEMMAKGHYKKALRGLLAEINQVLGIDLEDED